MTRHAVVGVELSGAGAHPAAWRWPGAVDGLLDAARLVGLATTAERGDLDLVHLDDTLDEAPPGTAALPRLDALLALARVAPATRRVGLVAVVTTTHTEPFHVSKNVASLDLVSGGRAGWHVRVSTSAGAAQRFGRRNPPAEPAAYAEAEDVVEVASRLWDSWEDDAVIRDVTTGRYLDREKVHYVDFHGTHFDVRGPSITPRSPQGQPVVVVAAASPPASRLAVRRADAILVDAPDLGTAARRRRELRCRIESAGRDPNQVSVLLRVRLGEPGLRRHLDALGDGPGATPPGGFDLVDGGEAVADQLGDGWSGGAVDGFLVAVDLLPAGLDWFVDEVAARWRAAGLLRSGTDGETLRDRLGLDRPPNRYAQGARL